MQKIMQENEREIIDLTFKLADEEKEKYNYISDETKDVLYKKRVENTYNMYMNHYKKKGTYKDYDSHKHKESVDGINIDKYLNIIRDEKYEYLMILFIKDNIVGEMLLVKGTNQICCVNEEERNLIINTAKRDNYSLYIVHNHPYEFFNASPSGGDLEYINNRFSKFVNVVDWGVVTKYDYFSWNQTSENFKNEVKKRCADKEYYLSIMRENNKRIRSLTYDQILQKRDCIKTSEFE